MALPQTYEIKLPQFEGPFDLLLFFIERDELDIYDIPIAKITDEFLLYMQEMKALNIDLASEFILVAATLMRIKAKMLLPRKELDEEGNEIDPRQDLIERLIEYKRYKEVLGDLVNLEEKRLLMHRRGSNNGEMKTISDSFATETELSNLNLYQIMRVFQRVLLRLEERRDRITHQVTPYPYTVQECKSDLRFRIKGAKDMPFEQAFEFCHDRVHAIFTYLAILDLVQLQYVRIKVGVGFNNFWISEGPGPESGIDEETGDSVDTASSDAEAAIETADPESESAAE